MLSGCNYGKTKVLYHLAKLSDYIEKHAIADANTAGHPLCAKMFEEMNADIEKHIDKLKSAVAGLSREGKY
ncbi:MAG: hypothetical protein V1702_06425 [Candidatus Woesearchaeota archaeon]